MSRTVKVASVSFQGACKIRFSWHSSETAPLSPTWMMRKVKEWAQFLQSGTFTVIPHFVYCSQDNLADLIKALWSVSPWQMMSWGKAPGSVLWRLISLKVWWWPLCAAPSPWFDKQFEKLPLLFDFGPVSAMIRCCADWRPASQTLHRIMGLWLAYN